MTQPEVKWLERRPAALRVAGFDKKLAKSFRVLSPTWNGKS